jgi:tetratricopeptide (TPR) repeat protein
MRCILAFALLLALVVPVHADEILARDHFERGVAAYDEGRYDDALHEFEAARDADPLPAFDYNIARCADRLGHKTEAIAAYEHYLVVEPSADNIAKVRERLVTLRQELVLPTPTVTVSALRSPIRRWSIPGVVGGSALVVGSIGASLLGSAASNYHGLESSCSPKCAPSTWSTIPAREHAGEVLLGVAAVTALVDIALIVRAARKK